MPTYETPGVYYERLDAGVPPVPALRTDIAAFVGIAARGPLDKPVPVQSWRQFRAYFGDFTPLGYLAYAVRAFYENGGRRCWVVRVASRDPLVGASAATASLSAAGGGPIWVVEASSPGVWGDRLALRLVETHRVQTVSAPAGSIPEATAVRSTAGFRRALLVRIRQSGRPPLLRVISDVDAVRGRLVWLNPRPEMRLRYDRPLALPPGYDPSAPLLIESVEYTLTVYEAGALRTVYEGLTLVPEDLPAYGPARLSPTRVPDGRVPLRREMDELVPGRREAGAPSPAAPEPLVIRELRDATALAFDPATPLAELLVPLALAGGADGLAALRVEDFIGHPEDMLAADDERELRRRGLRALETVDEVAIVAVPDIHIRPAPPSLIVPPPPCEPDPCLPGAPAPEVPAPAPAAAELPPIFDDEQVARVQAAMVQHCEERRDRVALLDAPFSAARDDALGSAAIRAWRGRFDTSYAALYYPWVRVADPLRTAAEPTRAVPPCGHVAGQYARTDLAAGTHRAPANAPLEWAENLTADVNETVHGLLNREGINVIRVLPARGLRIMGARTMSSDSALRYINVRRLLLLIGEALGLASAWAAFEPNDWRTRARMRLMISSYLLELWQRGALAGAAAEAAFQVRCDEENNPPAERGNGRLLAEVLVAPAQPYEFVVLRVGRVGNELEVREAGVARA
jgi:uncharacterized protein